MKNTTILILGALAAVAVFILRKGGAPGLVTLTNSVTGSQITLGNGNVYDNGTGVLFDAMNGSYTDLKTGKTIYQGVLCT